MTTSQKKRDQDLMKKQYIVIEDHVSEFPNPIHFSAGDSLIVGEEYVSDEDWDNWLFCSFNDLSGWVPKQLIEFITPDSGIAKDNYTASELNVKKEDSIIGFKKMNGWVWCENTKTKEQGWIPESHLKEVVSY